MNLELLVHDSYTTSAGQAAFAYPAQTVAVDTAMLRGETLEAMFNQVVKYLFYLG